MNRDKLVQAMRDFKGSFAKVSEEAARRWLAVQCFADHWDLETADMSTMIANAFERSNDLFAGKEVMPIGMLRGFAEVEPDTTREMFRMLYDESLPLTNRVGKFHYESDQLMKRHWTRDVRAFQGFRTISTYLFLRFPEKYFIFISAKFEAVARYLEYTNIPRRGELARLPAYFGLANGVLDFIKSDATALRMLEETVPDGFAFTDGCWHMLADDFLEFISQDINDDDEDGAKAAPAAKQGAAPQTASRYATGGAPVVPVSLTRSPLAPTPIMKLLRHSFTHKNMLLYGPSGTGKTYEAALRAISLVDSRHIDEVRAEAASGTHDLFTRFETLRRLRYVDIVTFHPAYTYDDFIEGLKPKTVRTSDGSTRVKMKPTDGVFKRFCSDARKAKGETRVFIIDEIDKGDARAIFGEAITLLDESKRLGEPEAMSVRLMRSGEDFGIPSNVCLICTASSSSIDSALARRFAREEMLPQPDVLRGVFIAGIDVAEVLRAMNVRLELLLGRTGVFGHACFTPLLIPENRTMECLAEIFRYKVLPSLADRFGGDWSRVAAVLADDEKPAGERIIRSRSILDMRGMMSDAELLALKTDKVYDPDFAALYVPEAYTGIYSGAPGGRVRATVPHESGQVIDVLRPVARASSERAAG